MDRCNYFDSCMFEYKSAIPLSRDTLIVVLDDIATVNISIGIETVSRLHPL